MPNISIILDCLCSDGFIAPTAIFAGLRAARNVINLQQRDFSYRTQLFAGVVSNQHVALSALIRELHSENITGHISLSIDQLNELMACEEEIQSLPAAAISPTSSSATRKSRAARRVERVRQRNGRRMIS